MTRSALVTLVLLAACGGSSSLQSRTVQGATLEGTVQGPTGQLSVSVPGTTIATHTDAAGHFALLNVPAGSSAVHFSGSGVDASLDIPAMAKQEHRSISVSVSGHDAVEHHEQSEADLKAAIDTITAPSFTAGGKTVTTTSATVFKKAGAAIAFGDLTVGDTVEVEGAVQQDGSVLARSVTVEDAAGANDADAGTAKPAETEVTFEGTVSANDNGKLTVGTTTVTTDASTRIEKGDQAIAASAIAQGDQVKVEGTLQADASVLAKEIKVMSAAEQAQVMVAGTVASLAADGFAIGATAIKVDSHTSFRGSGSFASLADVHLGDLLDVEAAKQADGSLLALSVHRLDVPEINEVEVEGAITAIGAASITVQGKTFAVDSGTEIDASGGGAAPTFASLQMNQIVNVRGVAAADGSLKATRIQIESGH